MEKNEENQQRNTNEEIKNNSDDNTDKCVDEATTDNNSNKIQPQLHQQRYTVFFIKDWTLRKSEVESKF